MQIIQKFLEPNIYSRPQKKIGRIKKIAVHYVGNPGTSAIANRNYFDNLKNTHKTYASSHYIIGLDGEIIQCIPESEISYATNDANSYSISIENCHPLADGKFTKATRESLTELCADICKRYGLDPLKDIIRHYDVTGKLCPLYWVTHPQDFAAFKEEVKTYMEEAEDMVKITELDKRVAALESVPKEKVYNTKEEIPGWGREAVDWCMENGILTGETDGLGLTYSMLRMAVMLYRAKKIG